MHLDRFTVSHRVAVDTDDHSGVGVGDTRHAVVGSRGPATESVQFAPEVAPECTLLIGECDRDNVEVMDYVRQGERLDSRHLKVLLVYGLASRITVNGKS